MDGDQIFPCDACGGSFVFSGREAAFFAEKGFSPPRRCTGARKARKASGAAERYDSCPFGQEVDAQGQPVAGAPMRSYTYDPGRPSRPSYGGGGGGAPRGGGGGRGGFGGGGERRAPSPTGPVEDATGEVIRWFVDRSFGFVRDQHGRDHYVHLDDWTEAPQGGVSIGQQVAFESFEAPRGRRARAVRLA